RVVRMDCERRVPEHRFGPGRRDHGAGGNAGDVVADPVQRAVRLLVNDLEIRDRRPASRTPVHDVAAAVDQSLPIELDERVAYRGRYVVNWCPRCGTAVS